MIITNTTLANDDHLRYPSEASLNYHTRTNYVSSVSFYNLLTFQYRSNYSSKDANCQISLGYGFHKIENMEKKWISDFVGVGYRYTDIVMNILILYSDRKLAIKTWNENIHWWPDDQIVLRFIEDGDYYWFILYQRGKNLFSKENVGFFKRNQLTQNYLRFKENFDQKTILRFSLYKSVENKTNDEDKTQNNENVYKRNSPGFELNIFKRLKTIYDVKFLNKSELDSNSIEHSLIKNLGSQYA